MSDDRRNQPGNPHGALAGATPSTDADPKLWAPKKRRASSLNSSRPWRDSGSFGTNPSYVAEQYPFVQSADPAALSRSSPPEPYADGAEKCVGCGLCAWACPADAILRRGRLEHSRCPVFCGRALQSIR